jgi:3-phenylpropionate/trans-cinnamate dioxygenase ferredoxin subunit
MLNYTKLDPAKCDFVEVAESHEVQDGDRLFVEIDDLPVVIFRVGGYLYAIGDVCTHDDGPLGEGELEDHEIVCPRHGARFDIRNGKVLSLPAVVDIPAYPVRESSGVIKIGIPVDSI